MFTLHCCPVFGAHYSHPRHLDMLKEYYENGKIKTTTYFTYEGLKHTKHYYFYDKNLNLIRQIDSLGWYQKSKDYPKLERIKSFKYKNGLLFETIDSTENRQHVERFDNEGRTIESCYNDKETQDCARYLYTVENGKFISKTMINAKKETRTTRYSYNSKGLPFEESQIDEKGKLVYFVRYHYKY
jgi:antitoxin component YwqK of YwqJK toxin-antitoxin module